MRGIVSYDWFRAIEDYKELLFPFEQIYVPLLSECIEAERDCGEPDEKASAIEWLVEQDFLIEPPVCIVDEDTEDDEVSIDLADQFLELKVRAEQAQENGDENLAAFQYLVAAENYLSRGTSYLIWRDQEEIAIPISFPYGIAKSPSLARSKVLSVVISEFPRPSDKVPLQDLIEFKRDPETRHKFRRFSKWVRRVATEDLGRGEISEEFRTLVDDYRYHMQLLDKDSRRERFEILATTVPDVVQDVTRLRFGDAMRRLFRFRNVEVAAHKQEMKSPGCELAYIQDAIDHFE